MTVDETSPKRGRRVTLMLVAVGLACTIAAAAAAAVSAAVAAAVSAGTAVAAVFLAIISMLPAWRSKTRRD